MTQEDMIELLKKRNYIYWRDVYLQKVLEEANQRNGSNFLREDIFALTFIKTVLNERRNDIIGADNNGVQDFGDIEISRNIMVCAFIYIAKLTLAIS
jgi:hypothetical protein